MTERKMPGTLTQQMVLGKVRNYIRTMTENPVSGTPTGDVLEDALDSSGKMVRPKLLLLCGSLGPDCSERMEQLCMLAAMVELTHLSSLIHDDIIDEAPLRRGKPSTQSKYGKDAAVYAGDFLISRVNYWLAKERLNDAAMRLNKTVEEMCIGEIGQAGCRYRKDVTPEAYYRNIKGKTASLFKCACAMGAAEGGCCDEVIETLEQFGECLGVMFQLRDDLLDFTSTRQEAGKQTHKDFLDGIYTLPVLMALRQPEGRRMLEPIMDANCQGNLTPEEIGQMENIVRHLDGVEATWEEIHRQAALGHQLLDCLEANESVEKLRRMLDQLDKREGE